MSDAPMEFTWQIKDSDPQGSPTQDDLIPIEISKANEAELERSSATHRKLMSLFLAEAERQRPNRIEMAIDEGFQDHDHWTDVEAELIEDLGHVPMTVNVGASTILYLIGTERRGRTDYKILPRRKDGAAAAQRKTEIMKYLDDTNQSRFEWSAAFKEAVTAGLGWMECGVQNDDEGEPIYEAHESYRNILHDSAATDLDLEGGRYIFRTKWTDVDTAQAFFPDKKAKIAIASAKESAFDLIDEMTGDPMDSHESFLDADGTGGTQNIDFVERPRVRLIEAWVKIPMQDTRVRGGQFNGELFDPSSAGHVDEINSGQAELVDRVVNRMFVVIFTTAGIVHISPSPYRHNRFPFTPIWGHRRASDGQAYGVWRGLRDLARNVNKRFSHALFVLVHKRVVMDEGAVLDLDALEDEVNRPTAIIAKRPGYNLDIATDTGLVAMDMEMMSQSIDLIQAASGVTDESLGRTTNASSGKAIIARQEQGALASSIFFDNLLFARQAHGAKKLSLVEQYMTEEKQFRITNQRGQPTFVTINDGLPENDIVRTKADFIVGEDAFGMTRRQAGAAQLMELLTQLAPAAPEIAVAILDLAIEMLDLPNVEEIVKRIRNISGQEDPDADPDAPDPERDARKAAEAEAAEYQKRLAMAELSKVEGEAAKAMATAKKTDADIEKIMFDVQQALGQATDGSIETKRKALELALAMIQNAAAADMTDAILDESGYQSPTGSPAPAGDPASIAPPPEAVAPAEQPEDHQQQPIA